MRGLIDVRDLIKRALQGIESSSGGHENAVGATFQAQDLKRFRNNIFHLLSRLETPQR